MNDDCIEVTQHPPWREALVRFIAAGYAAGDLVTHDWLHEALGLVRPGPQTPLAVADGVRMEYLRQLTQLRQALLIDHKVDLASKPGVGYTVIPSHEQSARAGEEGQAEVNSALKRMQLRIVHVDFARLTSGQRQEAANDLARAAAMAAAIRHSTRRLSFHDADDDGE